MKRFLQTGIMAVAVLMVVACSTPSQRINNVRLGMTSEEVMEEMGKPYAVRSAKLFRDGNFQEVWEYIPSIFSVALFADRYDKSYWVFFDDGRVVQWGEPGDMTGATTVRREEAVVTEFVPERRAR